MELLHSNRFFLHSFCDEYMGSKNGSYNMNTFYSFL